MSKESAPPLQNESPRFLKSWMTNLLAHPRNMSVIFKYQRKNKKNIFAKKRVNEFVWYPSHKNCLHHLPYPRQLSDRVQRATWQTSMLCSYLPQLRSLIQQLPHFIDCFLCARLLPNVLHKHLKLITLGHSFHFW